MKTAHISNVVVAHHVYHHTKQFWLAWKTEYGCKFHVWCDADHKPGETIFKNPPDGVERYASGYFPTRHLRPDSKVNAAMLAAAIRIADAHNRWQEAIDSREAAEMAEAVGNIRKTMDHNRHAAGPKLLDALKLMVPEYERMNRSCGVDGDDLFLKTARAAIAAAEPNAEQLTRWAELHGQAAVDAALAEEGQ